MNFYEGMKEVFLSRWDNRQEMRPLLESKDYTDCQKNLDTIFDDLGLDKDSIQAIRSEIRNMCDLEAQYFYRSGIQDGVKLTSVDFLTKEIA